LDIVFNSGSTVEQVVYGWERCFVRFIQGRNNAIVEIDISNCVVGKSICKDREEVSRAREKSGGLHLVNRDATGIDEVSNMDTPTRGEASELTKTGLNDHRRGVVACTILLMESEVYCSSGSALTHMLISNRQAA
jgi:hypothetical protein